MSHRLDFICLLRLKRPDFLTTMTPEEQAVMGEHIEYIRNISAQGNIALSGAAVDGSVGVVIYRVDSAEEARRLFYNDPAVIAGIGYPELHPFRIGYPTAI